MACMYGSVRGSGQLPFRNLFSIPGSHVLSVDPARPQPHQKTAGSMSTSVCLHGPFRGLCFQLGSGNLDLV